jgi:hypothetical protein
MVKQITDYTLYRWRYILGYVGIGLFVVGLIIIAGFFAPGGITHDEMSSVVTSSMLSIESFDPATMVNLPYHILQRISIDLLGVTDISIKLPSLVLGTLSTLGILILLRTWFRRNVAVITTILVLTTGQLLFVTQNGTPSILYIFWSVWLLVAATMVSRRATWLTVWKIALFGIAALSLYTPLSIYILFALLTATALHPHLRFLVRQLSKQKLAIGGICALILIAPLVYAIIRQPALGMTLLGIPQTIPDIQANVFNLLQQYFDFVTPSSGVLMTPVYGLGSMALILLGIFQLATAKYTARSYLIAAWTILLLPVLLLNPSLTSVSFVPILLLMAMGMNTLITNWYSLFPHNPYARIAGLIPLAVLISGMMFTGIDRFTYGYLYDPNTADNFSKDLRLVNATLDNQDRGKTVIVVNFAERAFYEVVADHRQDIAITDQQPATADTTIYTRSARQAIPRQNLTLTQIVTSDMSQSADRFYVYKTAAK